MIAKLETGDIVLPVAESTCRRQQNGRLDIIYPDGEFADVQLIPTFPLSQRHHMVAVLDVEGNEIALIDDVSHFDNESRRVVKDELDRSYFMPRIEDITHAEERLGVLTIETKTNRGERTVQIRNARRSIRKLPNRRVVILDVDGNRYEVKDWMELPAYGRDLLSQYM